MSFIEDLKRKPFFERLSNHGTKPWCPEPKEKFKNNTMRQIIHIQVGQITNTVRQEQGEPVPRIAAPTKRKPQLRK